MSFLNKLGLGKKHEDEYTPSFDNAPLPPDPGQNNFTPTQNDPYAPPQPAPPSNADPYSTSAFTQNAFPNQNNQSFEQPTSTNFNPANPFEQPQQSFSPTPGQRMAQDYVSSQNNSQNNSQNTNTVPSNDKMELLQVKLDAIRSELSSITQRLQHIEQRLGDKKRGW